MSASPLDPSELPRLLLENLRDEAVLALDPAGRVSWWSPGAREIFGFGESEAVGRHVSSFYPEEDVPLGAPGRELRRAEADGHFETEAWQIRKGGERFWAHISTSVLRDPEGRVLSFSRVVRDITQRLRTEEALRFSEAKFSGIVSIASEAIVSIDEAQRIVLYNQGAEQIFGYSPEEVIGQPLNLLIPERYREVHPKHLREFAGSPVVARRMGERGEIDIFGLRKNGEVFPMEASISKLEIGGRRLYTAVMRDITERKRASLERETLLEREREARTAAEEAAQARDDVLRIVSHDLGNSLSAMLVTTRVLMRTLPDEEWSADARRRIESVRHLAEQMQRLRQDLLDVARLEAGQLSMIPERQDPRAFIEAGLRDFAAVAEEKSVELTARVNGDLPMVEADRERILQVLSNLLANAIKFTPEGGRVVLGAEAGSEEVRFFVEDTGVGIAPEDLPHVFDRFWQAKAAHRAGAGLGLAISKGIAEAHGGRIWVESEHGTGSVFQFTVPVGGSRGDDLAAEVGG